MSVDQESEQTLQPEAALAVRETQPSSLVKPDSVGSTPVVADTPPVIAETGFDGPLGFVRRQVSRMVSWFKSAAKGISRMFSVNVPDDD